MAWVRSDQALIKHPKMILLKSLLGVELDAAVGRLHFLWWWCLDYALDGNLTKHHPKVIENACHIPLKLLISSKFVDRRPYLRIHDWWDNQGNYLKIRFRDQPEKWHQIRDLYGNTLPMGNTVGNTVGNPMDVRTYGRTDVEDVRTDVTTKGNASQPRAGGRASATREKAENGAPPAPPPVAKVDQDEEPHFNHDSFVKMGWRKSEEPVDAYGWQHLERSLTKVEQVQSKMREKFYVERKWN